MAFRHAARKRRAASGWSFVCSVRGMARRLLVTAVVLGALVACRSPTDSTSKKPAASAPTAVGGGPEHGTMFVEHFARTLEMRDAVIHGDLERAHRAARAIAAYDLPAKFPERWAPFIAEIREAANAGAEAETLERAGVSVSRIATTCGDCHRILGSVPGGPNFVVGEPPDDHAGPAASQTKAQMARHAWAVDRLWMGLIQPSDRAWRRGSEVLAVASLATVEQGSQNEALVARVHALGELGRTLVGQAEPPAPANAPRRTDTFGQILSTCAGCHAR
jgi:cytochrome c553